MNSEQLFKAALGIENPWEVVSVRFKNNECESVKELHIDIDFKRGAKFSDETDKLCGVYDTKQRTWRHLDFFQHPCYLHCRVPRIKCSDGQIKLVEVPWSRAGGGFTLLFEAYAMALIENEMPVNKLGKLLNEDSHRIWTIFNHWIGRAYAADVPTVPRKLGMDETSRTKGHEYITVAVDMDESKVIHVADGKDIQAVAAIKSYLESKAIDVNQIEHTSMDMSPSFIAGSIKFFPEAEIHFDRFHVVKLLNEAMDKVRQSERNEHDELKGHKYTFLKNKENLSNKRLQELSDLMGVSHLLHNLLIHVPLNSL